MTNLFVFILLFCHQNLSASASKRVNTDGFRHTNKTVFFHTHTNTHTHTLKNIHTLTQRHTHTHTKLVFSGENQDESVKHPISIFNQLYKYIYDI